MESLIAKSKSDGLDWQEDPRNRRPRPPASRPGTGATSEVFGSSFGPKKRPAKSVLERNHDPTNGSDDELDSIASSDRERSKSPSKSLGNNGQEDPVAKAIRVNSLLKTIKFSKTSKSGTPSTLPPSQPEKAKEPVAAKRAPSAIHKPSIARSASSTASSSFDISKAPPKSSSQSSLANARSSATTTTRRTSSRTASSSKRPDSPVHLSSDDDNDPPSRRPKPKPKPKAVPKPKAKKATAAKDALPVSSQASSSSSRPRRASPDTEPTPKPRRKAPIQAAEFPLDLHSPLSSPAPEKAAGFPDMSPLSSPAVSRNRHHQNFPGLSPLSSPARSQEERKKGKASLVRRAGRRTVESDDDAEDDDDDTDFQSSKTRRAAAPFPMNTQALSSIESPTGSKRLSDGSLEGVEPSTKRRKSYINPDMTMNSDDEDLFLTPAAAPDTLCPFCDSKLPSSPTPLLQRLIADLVRNSTPDKRPTNPLGRKAPMNTYLSMCQRHDFERKLLPQAEKKGWPKEIEWSKIEGRIRKMEQELRELIDDGDSSLQVEVTNANIEDKGIYSANGPRARCIFWRELMQEVKAKGASKATAVGNQFATFDKSQPGYYGEQGSAIIHQTLYDLFPPSTIDPSTIHPLPPAEFIQKILIPEVALRLIMEDRNLTGIPGIVEGVKTLRESSAYGVSMFPDDGAGEGNSGVADRMARKRAKKRRKQLDREEEIVQALQAGAMSVASDSEPTVPPVVKARPKPKAATKSRQRSVSVDIDLSSDASYSGNESPTASQTYETSRRAPAPAPFPMDMEEEKGPASSEEPDLDFTNDVSDHDIDATPRPKARASSRKPPSRLASKGKMGHSKSSSWLLSSP